MDYKIVNGKLLVRNSNDEFSVEKCNVYIKGNKIFKISNDDLEGYQSIDATGKLIMPGLINMHTHSYMSVFKNYADDIPFNAWLFDKVMPAENRLSGEAAYWSSLLACIEMIKSGTTCFLDMHMFKSQVCEAVKKAGMRAFIGRGLVGEDLYKDGYSRFLEAMDERTLYENEVIKFVLSPHAIYSCSRRLLKQVSEEAQAKRMMKQIHLSESDFEVETTMKKYGRRPVELLADLGFLDENTILSHCVKLTEKEIDFIKQNKSSVVTNPSSNSKLGNGYAPVIQMMHKGVNLCIGTDSVASNNTLNMFREMGHLSFLHKALSNDPTALPAQDIIKMSTTNAAKALAMDGLLGEIKEGAYADMIFVDLRAPSMFPNNNIISSLCYSSNGSEVSSVMINGQFVLRDNEMITIDVEQVYFEIDKIVKKYL